MPYERGYRDARRRLDPQIVNPGAPDLAKSQRQCTVDRSAGKGPPAKPAGWQALQQEAPLALGRGDQRTNLVELPSAAPLAALEAAREELIRRINAELTREEREFLVSLKRLEPKWELLGLPGVELLPGPQWKLYNLRKMDAGKRQEAEAQLRKKLGV